MIMMILMMVMMMIRVSYDYDDDTDDDNDHKNDSYTAVGAAPSSCSGKNAIGLRYYFQPLASSTSGSFFVRYSFQLPCTTEDTPSSNYIGRLVGGILYGVH